MHGAAVGGEEGVVVEVKTVVMAALGDHCGQEAEVDVLVGGEMPVTGGDVGTGAVVIASAVFGEGVATTAGTVDVMAEAVVAAAEVVVDVAFANTRPRDRCPKPLACLRAARL